MRVSSRVLAVSVTQVLLRACSGCSQTLLVGKSIPVCCRFVYPDACNTPSDCQAPCDREPWERLIGSMVGVSAWLTGMILLGVGEGHFPKRRVYYSVLLL